MRKANAERILSQFSEIVPIKTAYLRYAVCGCCLCIKNANCYSSQTRSCRFCFRWHWSEWPHTKIKSYEILLFCAAAYSKIVLPFFCAAFMANRTASRPVIGSTIPMVRCFELRNKRFHPPQSSSCASAPSSVTDTFWLSPGIRSGRNSGRRVVHRVLPAVSST